MKRLKRNNNLAMPRRATQGWLRTQPFSSACSARLFLKMNIPPRANARAATWPDQVGTNKKPKTKNKMETKETTGTLDDPDALPPGRLMKKKLRYLEKELATAILMMIAGNLDRWFPVDDNDTCKAMVHSCHLLAQGIAKKLIGAISETRGKLYEKRWRKLVKAATHYAFVEVTDGGPLVKLGQNRSFVAAVAECTASVVAPAGSDWARSLKKRKLQREREGLMAWGVPPSKVDEFELMQKLRADRKA